MTLLNTELLINELKCFSHKERVKKLTLKPVHLKLNIDLCNIFAIRKDGCFL